MNIKSHSSTSRQLTVDQELAAVVSNVREFFSIYTQAYITAGKGVIDQLKEFSLTDYSTVDARVKHLAERWVPELLRQIDRDAALKQFKTFAEEDKIDFKKAVHLKMIERMGPVVARFDAVNPTIVANLIAKTQLDKNRSTDA